MTEYDFSPGALAAHLRKMEKIKDWRSAQDPSRFLNPFLPTEAGDPPRPTRTISRAHSVPAPHYQHGSQNPKPSRYSSRTLVDNPSYTGGSTPHASSSTQSPQYSRPSSRAHTRPPPSRSRTYSPDYAVRESHRPRSHSTGRSHSYPDPRAETYLARPGQPVVVHSAHESYVVIPSRRTRIEVRNDSSSPNRYAVSPPRYTSSPDSYSRRHELPAPSAKKPPFMRRLFGLGDSQSPSRRSSGDASRRTKSIY